MFDERTPGALVIKDAVYQENWRRAVLTAVGIGQAQSIAYGRIVRLPKHDGALWNGALEAGRKQKARVDYLGSVRTSSAISRSLA